MLPKRLAILINRSTLCTRFLARLVTIVALHQWCGRTTTEGRSRKAPHGLVDALGIQIPFTHLLVEESFVNFVVSPAHVENVRRLFVLQEGLHEGFAFVIVKAEQDSAIVRAMRTSPMT